MKILPMQGAALTASPGQELFYCHGTESHLAFPIVLCFSKRLRPAPLSVVRVDMHAGGYRDNALLTALAFT